MKALKARWDKMKKRDKYISIAIFSLTWYTMASLIMTALGVPPPDVLTGIKIFRKDDTTL